MKVGLVDQHIHGYRGLDAQSADPRELLKLSIVLGRAGLTGFFPTYVSATEKQILQSMKALVRAVGHEQGAVILGLHLEGPFLNPIRAGSHPKAVLRSPSLAEAKKWVATVGPLLKIVTLAPELPGAEKVIRYLVSQNVKVQMGHTTATYAQAKRAKAWGVTGVTHLYNAMGPLDREAPSLTDFALEDKDLTTELIHDGVHVSNQLVAYTLRKRPKGKVVFISDCCAASGFPVGHKTRFAGAPVVTAPDGSIRRKDGTLAAAGLLLNRIHAVKSLRCLSRKTR
jgi:N-acetylglucosamine-6-phosphate deacetylase